MAVDADALNLLAIEPVQRDNWILTPHPGEAARLLNKTSKDIQADRFAAVKALQQQFGGVVVLKGAGSLVAAAGSPLALCDAGNPGMASGGMGDVLTGAIAGLLAQRQTLKTDPAQALAVAARLGVSVHARAADIAANEGGERGLLASDVIAALREVVNPAQF
jgi:NAD(P)H-hydrate epimerase